MSTDSAGLEVYCAKELQASNASSESAATTIEEDPVGAVRQKKVVLHLSREAAQLWENNIHLALPEQPRVRSASAWQTGTLQPTYEVERQPQPKAGAKKGAGRKRARQEPQQAETQDNDRTAEQPAKARKASKKTAGPKFRALRAVGQVSASHGGSEVSGDATVAECLQERHARPRVKPVRYSDQPSQWAKKDPATGEPLKRTKTAVLTRKQSRRLSQEPETSSDIIPAPAAQQGQKRKPQLRSQRGTPSRSPTPLSLHPAAGEQPAMPAVPVNPMLIGTADEQQDNAQDAKPRTVTIADEPRAVAKCVDPNVPETTAAEAQPVDVQPAGMQAPEEQPAQAALDYAEPIIAEQALLSTHLPDTAALSQPVRAVHTTSLGQQVGPPSGVNQRLQPQPGQTAALEERIQRGTDSTPSVATDRSLLENGATQQPADAQALHMPALQDTGLAEDASPQEPSSSPGITVLAAASTGCTTRCDHPTGPLPGAASPPMPYLKSLQTGEQQASQQRKRKFPVVITQEEKDLAHELQIVYKKYNMLDGRACVAARQSQLKADEAARFRDASYEKAANGILQTRHQIECEEEKLIADTEATSTEESSFQKERQQQETEHAAYIAGAAKWQQCAPVIQACCSSFTDAAPLQMLEPPEICKGPMDMEVDDSVPLPPIAQISMEAQPAAVPAVSQPEAVSAPPQLEAVPAPALGSLLPAQQTEAPPADTAEALPAFEAGVALAVTAELPALAVPASAMDAPSEAQQVDSPPADTAEVPLVNEPEGPSAGAAEAPLLATTAQSCPTEQVADIGTTTQPQGDVLLPTAMDILDRYEADVPAIWSHPGALKAFEQVVKDHIKRRDAAQQYGSLAVHGRAGNLSLQGRDLDGFASRCGALMRPGDRHVQIGCGTALADVHYHCYYCHKAEAEEETNEEPDFSLDYCQACMEANQYTCPNPNCLSKDRLPLEPRDFMRDSQGLRPFAQDSLKAVSKCRETGKELAETMWRRLKRALDGLPEECKPQKGSHRSMYEADLETAKAHELLRNGLDEGIPVLVTGADAAFDSTPFSPQAMYNLALENEDQAGGGFTVKAQFDTPGGATNRAKHLSVKKFFAPMLRKAHQPLEVDAAEGDDHAGFKAPDFGIQPVEQSKAFVEGMYRLGVGEIVDHKGLHNIAGCLRSETEDPVNGTQVPDLGPKFYIARPRIRRSGHRGQARYDGFTFTPLHCDLADAVNYSCSGESATWHIFHRDDRQKLMQFLGDKYADGEEGEEINEVGGSQQRKMGEDMLWNPTNHRLLDAEDLVALAAVYDVRPWKVSQHAGELVLIPAGCAHQVKNGSGNYNIKIAQDFIAPQSAAVCLELLNEMRLARQEDKLQAVLSLRFAGAKARQLLPRLRRLFREKLSAAST